MKRFEVPVVDYTRYSDRQLATVPLVVLSIALLVIAGTWVLTGAPVRIHVPAMTVRAIASTTSGTVASWRSEYRV